MSMFYLAEENIFIARSTNPDTWGGVYVPLQVNFETKINIAKLKLG